MNIRLVTFKRGLLLFWAVWFSLVFATNVLDGLKELGVLPETWSYTSRNFRFVVSVVQLQGARVWLATIMFIGVVVWEGMCAALFWRAFRGFGGGGAGRALASTAFAASVALWAAFTVAIEAFIAFEKISPTGFEALLGLNLVSLLALRLLPDD